MKDLSYLSVVGFVVSNKSALYERYYSEGKEGCGLKDGSGCTNW